jgi:hypothetical protein
LRTGDSLVVVIGLLCGWTHDIKFQKSLDHFSYYVYVHFLPVIQPWIHLPQFELDIHVPVWKCWSLRARNNCRCWCVHAIVPVLWGMSRGSLATVAFSIHTKCKKGIFWRNFGVLLDFFVLNVAEAFWSYSTSGFVPPNLTAHENPSLRVRSIFYLGHFHVMADHATEPFVLHAWLLRRTQLKYGKIRDNHIAGKKTQRKTLSTHFTCITWMDFVYGRMTTAHLFFTYVTKCIYNAFF